MKEQLKSYKKSIKIIILVLLSLRLFDFILRLTFPDRKKKLPVGDHQLIVVTPFC